MPQRPDIVARAWDCKEVDWNEYESHRPPYTKALYDLIFQHHEQHSGQHEAALDIGAGGEHDQSEEYVTRAKQRFHEEADDGSITFLQRNFDEFQPEQDLPSGKPVDMITAGTCIHFAESSLLMAQLSPLLRSGGTVAAFGYGAIPILPADDPADPIVRSCKDKIMRWIHEKVYPSDKAQETGTGQSRYNNVAFDPEVWTNVRRITSLPQEPILPEWIEPAVSRVREDEFFEGLDDDFITKGVDYGFFPNILLQFRSAAADIGRDQKRARGVGVAMGDRKIVAKWPVIRC